MMVTLFGPKPSRIPNENFLFFTLALCCGVLFFFLNHDTFQFGYAVEDNAWLLRVTDSSFWSALRPVPGDYYRPISANIPYLIFSPLKYGLWLWKATSFVVLFLAYGFIISWMGQMAKNRWIGLALATVWLFHPSQSYGIYYVNAFDYVIFPFLLILLLWLLENEKYYWALFVLGLACFSKEMAFAFPFLFLIPTELKKDRPKIILPGAILVVIAAFLVHRGFSLQSAGGFHFAYSVHEVFKNGLYHFFRIFLQGPAGLSLDLLWYCVACFLFLAAQIFGLWKGNYPAQRKAYFLILAACLFFLPIPMLHRLLSIHLGPIFWVFLLGSVAAGKLFSGWKESRQVFLSVFLIFGLMFWACFASESRTRIKTFILDNTEVFAIAEPLLRQCGVFDRVVTSGLESVLRGDENAESAIWGFRLRYPHVRFFLEKPSRPVEIDQRSRLMWVELWQISGYPKIQFSLDSHGHVVAASSGDGKCKGSLLEQEALNPPPQ